MNRAEVLAEVLRAFETAIATECGPLSLMGNDGTMMEPDNDSLPGALGGLLTAGRIDRWPQEALAVLASLIAKHAPEDALDELAATAADVTRDAEDTRIGMQIAEEHRHLDTTTSTRCPTMNVRSIATELALVRRIVGARNARPAGESGTTEAA